MVFQYLGPNEQLVAIEVGKVPLTIGRDMEADIVIDDKRLSRLHCRLTYEKGLYYLEDLKSKNGTFLNGHAIERTTVKSGDRIRIGGTQVLLKDHARPGTNTVLCDVQDRMAQGKGYHTIMHEIMQEP